MTEPEAKAIMKAHGWTYLPRMRGQRKFVYAERKVEGKKREKYIGSIDALASMTQDDLIRLLTT